MTEWFSIVKMLVKSFFRRGKNEKTRRASLIVSIISGLILVSGLCVFFVFFGAYIKQYKILPEVTALIMVCGFITVLIFGIAGIFSYVYFAKDNEFLLALPVSPSAVYSAKLIVIYLQEVSISTFIILPTLITLGISSMQGWMYYVAILLAVVFVPVISLAVGSILVIPIAYVASFFKNKGALSAVILLLVFGVCMGLYMYFVMVMESNVIDSAETDINGLLKIVRGVFTTIANVFYPFYALARFGTMTTFYNGYVSSLIIDLFVFLGSVVVAVALVVILSHLVYARSALKMNEHATSKVAERAHEQNSALKALIKREWRELYRNTSFAFQCLAGVVVTPIMAVIMSILNATEMNGATVAFDKVLSWLVAMMMVQMLGACMNVTAMTAVSREGKSFAYSKVIPVPFETQVKAKVLLSCIVSWVATGISLVALTVVSVIFGFFDISIVVGSFIYLGLYVPAFATVCVKHDLKKPNLFWITAREAVKNNTAMVAPLLVGVLISILSMIVVLVLGALFDYFGLVQVGVIIAFAVLSLACGLVLWLETKSIGNNVNKYYDVLSV